MIIAVPLVAAAALTIFALMAGRKPGEAALPAGAPPSDETPPGGADVHPETPASAPAGALPGDSKPATGDEAVAHADDAFDAAVAAAIAKGDPVALEALAVQAEKLGLFTVARSIRDEIARIKATAPVPTPSGPDKPVVPSALATYIVRSGDTGSSIAKAYTGNPNRWPELVTVNPGSKDAKYGFKANVGQRINIPASWPSGIPVPIPPVAAAAIPPAPPVVHNTYLVQSGDTGEKVAAAFTGDKSRWKELLTVNPSLKSAQYGISLYTGHRINLPANWPATPQHSAAVVPAVTAPVPLPAPPAAAPVVQPTTINVPEQVITPGPASPVAVQSDARTAAGDLTSYLTSLGGLKGRWHEDRAKVKGLQGRMGISNPDGLYGHGSAEAVMLNGFVPVVPYYWASTGAAAQKTAFTNMVKSYQAADPQRSAQWSALLADIVRS